MENGKRVKNHIIVLRTDRVRIVLRTDRVSTDIIKFRKK